MSAPAALDKGVLLRDGSETRSVVPYRLVRLLGFDLVRRNYYSPIPDLDQLDPAIWEKPRDLPGLEIDFDRMLRLLDELRPFMSEAPAGGSMYGGLDAALLYGIVRRYQPERVLEVGSGMSTRIAAAAIQANGHGIIVSADPNVETPVDAPFAEHHDWPAETIPLAEFQKLKAGDILFVDTTHTVKIGSEVNRLILQVLTRLNQGVFVHFHDIFTPWEYPRYVPERQRGFWAEQYLLEAFLTENPRFEVLFAELRRHPRQAGSGSGLRRQSWLVLASCSRLIGGQTRQVFSTMNRRVGGWS